jgi:hypothetical protein
MSIVFENPGEIDLRSITSFGVSVKDTDNPIGFFGTGLKYAIAILIRTGHQVSIRSGLTEYEFGVRREKIRGKEFDFITVRTGRGKPKSLGFTTEVGKTWQLWMAYREIACNCRDEGGEGYRAAEMPDPEAGRTQVIVDGSEFEAIHAVSWRYLLEDAPDFEIGGIEVRERPSEAYFYRGIRVHALTKESLFTYNQTAALTLTEDRTVKEQWQIPYGLARAILGSTDERFLRRVLLAPETAWEAHLDFHGWSGTPASDAFLKVVGECAMDRSAIVNQTALKVWKDSTKSVTKPREIELTIVQEKSLNKALDFCTGIGFDIRGAYPIKVVEALGGETLGMAADQIIFISERAFHLGGTKQVASTLIEEYLHLRHGYEDCTRGMQNYLFEKLVSIGEELVGEPL